LKLERRIAADEQGGILHRWRYGRELLGAKAGRKQLPHGLIGDLVQAAARAGLKLSEREIQWRIKCATVYATEAQVRTAGADFGSWTALRDAGFPPVADEPDLLTELAESVPDSFEQLTLIPGLGPEINARGRRIPLAEATIADIRAYRDMYAQIHENYGKRLALIDNALSAMCAGADDDDANAVEAWQRGNA
jgi:hypothetical protein